MASRSWRLAAQLSAAIAAIALSACSSSREGTERGSNEAAGPVISLGQGTENRGVSAAAAGHHVVAVWAAVTEGSTNILSSFSDDDGATFSTPVRVNDVPGDARVNGEQPPRVAVAGAHVVVVWQSRLSGQTEVRAARSNDGGRSFGKTVTVHASGLTGSRGWSSVAVKDNGEARVSWLDTRDSAPPSKKEGAAVGGHQHGSSPMRQDVFHAIWRPDSNPVDGAVTTSVCFCCKTSTAIARDGATLIAFRHIYPTNLRDMAVSRSTDGEDAFSAPVRVSQDGWELLGCPEDGPALGVDDNNLIHIAWPTITGPDASRKGIFYAHSSDQGRSFAPRTRLDEGADVKQAQHPQLTTRGASAIVVWDELSSTGSRIKARLVTPIVGNNGAPLLSTLVDVSAPGIVTYPAVAATTAGYVVFWSESSESVSGIRAQRFTLH